MAIPVRYTYNDFTGNKPRPQVFLYCLAKGRGSRSAGEGETLHGGQGVQPPAKEPPAGGGRVRLGGQTRSGFNSAPLGGLNLIPPTIVIHRV